MAGRIRREDVEALRARADIAAVVSDHTQLKRAGSRLKGLCPFHAEKTPSLNVDPDRGFFHCFGCGEGGDVYSFLMKIQGMSFTEAVEQLARRTGFTLHYEDLTPGQRRALGERSRLVDLNTRALEFFRERLRAADGTPARDYLRSRGFGPADAERFQLGFAPNQWDALVRALVRDGYGQRELVTVGLAVNSDRGGLRDRFRGRLVFPVLDASGDPIGFGGRVVPGLDYGSYDPPKYYNSPETPLYHKARVLYGLPQARADMAATGEVLVCEGYTDVMALHQAEFGNAVATCGTSVGAEHFRLLARYVNRVVLAFDSDRAGIAAAEKAWRQAAEVDAQTGGDPFQLRVLVLPDGDDPAGFVQSRGVSALRTAVEQATPVVPFLLRAHLATADLTSPTSRAEALRDAVALLGAERDPDLRRGYARTEVADPIGVSLEWVQRTAARLGVQLDRHEGAAAVTVRTHQRGRIARVTNERAAQERLVLRVAMQHPQWLPDEWYELDAADFGHPQARMVAATLAAAGGAGVALSAVLDAAADDDARAVLRGVALEDPAVADTASATRQAVRRLLADRLQGDADAVAEDIAGVNPTVDPTRFRELNARRFELERRLRRLRDIESDDA